MQSNRRPYQNVWPLIAGLALLLSTVQPVTAQPITSFSTPSQDDGLRRSRDPQTGLLTFLGADPERPVELPAAMRAGIAADQRAGSILEVYGRDFGLDNPSRQLRVERTEHPSSGRNAVRYQQVYEGIPVLAGELIVNTTDQGALLSMSGEVSPSLNLSTKPAVTAARARMAAQALMEASYAASASRVKLTQPALWIFDERLLQPSSRPPQLVWRMDASIDGQPVRELILVNAQSGAISLHFNQVDAAWSARPVAQASALTLDKTSVQASYDSAGNVIDYSYLVSNAGGVSLAGPVTVTDDKTTVTCPDLATVGNLDGFLDPAESVMCTAAYTISQGDLNSGSVTNTATAHAGGTDSNQDSVTVTAVQSPALTLDKMADPMTYTAAGDVISYSYLVSNTGNVSLTGPVTVTDNKVAVTCPDLTTVGNLDGFLDPAESITCSGAYTIIQTDVNSGSVTNTATAQAGGTDSNQDSVTVTAGQSPALTLDKTADPMTYTAVGDVIDYSYAVSNAGNVSLAGPVTVTDDKTTVTCPDLTTVGNFDSFLDPAEAITCTAAYTIIQADLNSGSVTNTATAYAGTTDSNQDSVTATAAVRYVSTTGDDAGPNTCANPLLPCLTIQRAVNASVSGDTIRVGSGTYYFAGSGNPAPNVVIINGKALTLSGGWTADFTAQTGASTIDGETTNNGMLIKGGAHVTVRRFLIRNSISTNGGGIYLLDSTLSFEDGTLESNQAELNGAGIFLIGITTSLTLTNATLGGNSAGDSGGGLYASSGTSITSQNSTIAYNEAQSATSGHGGGGLSRPAGATGTVSLTNTILANNQAATLAPDCNGPINASDYNIYGTLTGCNLTLGTNDHVTDPLISGSLADTPPVYALLVGSPAIEGGTSTGCPLTDAQGTPRPQGSFCDIGAYELSATAGLPAMVSVYAGDGQETVLGQPFTQPLAALVRDGYGDPVIGADVLFSAPPTGASSNFSSSGSNAETVPTDASGIATSSTLTANLIAGSYIVSASVSGVATSASFSLRNRPAPGVPTSITVSAGSGQTAEINQAFANPLRAYVEDDYGTPVSGVEVTFTAPGAGASGTFAASGTNSDTAVTNGSGIATASTFTARDAVGTYVVTAMVPGVSLPASFTLTNHSSAWYVNSTRPDNNDSCNSPATACKTIRGAIGKASSGDIIYVASGTYTTLSIIPTDPVVPITKNITISGGWNASFTAQNGMSIVDGVHARQVVSVGSGLTAVLENINLTNGYAEYPKQGAGIYNQGTLILRDAAIYENRSDADGAGIYQQSGHMELTNVTISQNSAVNSGGAIYVLDGTLSINNSTISQNTAADGSNARGSSRGGGISNPFSKPVAISNTIIAGNSSGSMPDCEGQITSAGHNLIGFLGGCGFSPVAGDQVGVASSVSAGLGDLADNGGTGFTYALLIGSPAIDGGDPASCADTDQRGVARPQGAACDIGAFEGSVTQPVTGRILTYTAGNAETLPGTLLCDQSKPQCTVDPGRDPQADTAHQYALGIYDFYFQEHGRDGIDNNNMPLISTVHYGTAFNKAVWTGGQVVYGDAPGYANADDEVAHEWTHAVTQYESNLFYYYQSGAINESFSDLWGEAYDQVNGLGNDSADVLWLIGEDTTGLGAQRNMKNPPQFKDPDKMTSAYYYKGTSDNGGVHTNSGVNNKAVYLMVAGGTFNGRTVAPLGWHKVLTIYYEAQTSLLTSGSDYLDLYNALYQACLNKAGTAGIVAADCQQVRKATSAVEMNKQPSSGYNPDITSLCPSGTTYYQTPYYDDFETGSDGWNLQSLWGLSSGYATSGAHMLHGDAAHAYSNSSVMSPSSLVPSGGKAYLYFKHAFDFESSVLVPGGPLYYFDGGVLEYSVNGGGWRDAAPLFSAGKPYNGTIESNWRNPLGGRKAFVGPSHGYVGSRYTLTSLAGKSLRFRWRLGTDEAPSLNRGWFIDDVRVYNCLPLPSTPTLLAPANGAALLDYTPTLDWSNSTPSLDHYRLQIATDKTFAGASLLVDVADVKVSTYTPSSDLPAGKVLYWRVRAFNAAGGAKAWSSIFSFKTKPAKPILIYPDNGLNLPSNLPTFDWQDVIGATGYQIQVDTTNTFLTPFVIKANTVASAFTPLTALPAGKTLYWRVRATSPAGPSPWSGIWSFKTAP